MLAYHRIEVSIRHPEVAAAGGPRRVDGPGFSGRSSFEARKSAHLRMTELRTSVQSKTIML
jgi:hypothetical protein